MKNLFSRIFLNDQINSFHFNLIAIRRRQRRRRKRRRRKGRRRERRRRRRLRRDWFLLHGILSIMNTSNTSRIRSILVNQDELNFLFSTEFLLNLSSQLASLVMRFVCGVFIVVLNGFQIWLIRNRFRREAIH